MLYPLWTMSKSWMTFVSFWLRSYYNKQGHQWDDAVLTLKERKSDRFVQCLPWLQNIPKILDMHWNIFDAWSSWSFSYSPSGWKILLWFCVLCKAWFRVVSECSTDTALLCAPDAWTSVSAQIFLLHLHWSWATHFQGSVGKDLNISFSLLSL